MDQKDILHEKEFIPKLGRFIEYRTMLTIEEVEEGLEFLAVECLNEEPYTVAGTFTLQEMRDYMHMLPTEDLFQDGICLGAYDLDSGKLIGVSIRHDLSTRTLDSRIKYLDDLWGHMSFTALNDAISSNKITFTKGECCTHLMIAVNEEYSKCGIAVKLSQLADALAKKKGFVKVFEESMHRGYYNVAVHKLRYKVASEIIAGDFEHKGTKPYAGVRFGSDKTEIPTFWTFVADI